MLEKLSWHCIGHNPTTWGLGVRDGEALNNIHGRAWRNEDGSWNWSLVDGCLPAFGNEPNRVLAIESAQEANKARYNNKIFKSTP